MSEVTLKAIEELLDSKLDEKLEPINKTLAEHTAALEVLMTEKKTKDDSKTVSDRRLERLEHWGKKVGSKVEITLDL